MDEEVLLEDPPPPPAPAATAADPLLPAAGSSQPAAAAPAAAAAAAPAAGPLGGTDPLSSLASQAAEQPGAPGYQDVVQQQRAPPAALPAAGPLGAAAPLAAPAPPAPSSSSAPVHRQQPSLTLDSLEINADDAGYLRQQGAVSAGVAGTSARPPPPQITVSDPVRRVGDSVIPGLASTHYEYLVAAAWDAPQRRRVEVRRRFKDFVVGGREGFGAVWLLHRDGGLPAVAAGEMLATQPLRGGQQSKMQSLEEACS